MATEVERGEWVGGDLHVITGGRVQVVEDVIFSVVPQSGVRTSEPPHVGSYEWRQLAKSYCKPL